MTDQTPAETIAAIRATIAWYNAAPDAILNTSGDGLLEYAYSAIEDILAYDPITRNAVELMQHRDEQDGRAEDPDFFDTDVLDSGFWDRVEGAA